ncbi:MAG: Asp23/Gls24 family envelope stress response protein [Lachnospiraceae bacterium]|nr:Asp23/Gls24 family envelope stress response protein [Lachnospiraceae bacterium]MBO6299820.1 Asp23/Gls24 family envelope stress response protein [Lachnospiraceae bacterium]MBP3296155.1 Asp23/Gls24 family envelope stress response protein [Lachnospiraceae bacterium]
METNNITLRADENNVGSVQIADDVVSMIAALAASEVEGVSSVVGDITNEVMSKVGMKKLTKGVRVDLLDNKVSIDLSIMIGFGYPIPETSRLVQEKVKNSVETMTGLTVEDINIRVAAVNMSKVKG